MVMAMSMAMVTSEQPGPGQESRQGGEYVDRPPRNGVRGVPQDGGQVRPAFLLIFEVGGAIRQKGGGAIDRIRRRRQGGPACMEIYRVVQCSGELRNAVGLVSPCAGRARTSTAGGATREHVFPLEVCEDLRMWLRWLRLAWSAGWGLRTDGRVG